MKAWLGNNVFEVTQAQLDKINHIAEEEYRKTSDRAKGLQAAIDYCLKQGMKVVKEVNPMPSKTGEALPSISFAQLQEMIDNAVAKATAPKK